ncbi:hypothetical protein BJF78_04215 [Pseudonocardia sp. CNS-139]|nr:hypothetical protein BJF78_04215 [Pseudonocardia sp. CNS-139]
MSNAGFQAALAELLAAPQARRRLADDPAGLAVRFALADDELAALQALDPQRLEFTAGGSGGPGCGLCAACSR